MYCPRCGRPVNPEANFCGGCGLSKVEIEKYLQKTQPQQPPKAEEPAEAVFTPVEEAKAEPVFAQPAEEPKAEEQAAETVFAQSAQEPHSCSEPTFAEKEAAKEEQQTANYTSAYSYGSAENQSTANSSYAQSSTATGYSYGQTEAPQTEKPQQGCEPPLSTVDFIWMMIISGLPIIGLVYLIYLALQNDNINKRSFARANLIIAVFSFVIAFVFVIGVVAAGIF